MTLKPYLFASIAGMLSISAWAQSAPPKLDLTLPSASAALDNTAAFASKPPPNSKTAANGNAARKGPANDNAIVDAADSRRPACNDVNYGKPQVHGSVGVGVMAGNHVSGNYQTGSLYVSKAMGSCDHSTGDISFSINVSKGNFNNRAFRHRHW